LIDAVDRFGQVVGWLSERFAGPFDAGHESAAPGAVGTRADGFLGGLASVDQRRSIREDETRVVGGVGFLSVVGDTETKGSVQKPESIGVLPQWEGVRQEVRGAKHTKCVQTQQIALPAPL
jgi:hypothetical protein